MSHVDLKDFTKFMELLGGIYKDLSNKRGKVNEYLGMTIDLQTPGEMRITMVDYLKVVLEDFLEVITGRST